MKNLFTLLFVSFISCLTIPKKLLFKTTILTTDMSINLMELIKIHEIENDASIGVCGGMAMCASCQCYIESSRCEN